jgi:hypothetical protein
MGEPGSIFGDPIVLVLLVVLVLDLQPVIVQRSCSVRRRQTKEPSGNFHARKDLEDEHGEKGTAHGTQAVTLATALREGRQRTTATKSILPLLHSCPGGVRKSAIHSP